MTDAWLSKKMGLGRSGVSYSYLRRPEKKTTRKSGPWHEPLTVNSRHQKDEKLRGKARE